VRAPQALVVAGRGVRSMRATPSLRSQLPRAVFFCGGAHLDPVLGYWTYFPSWPASSALVSGCFWGPGLTVSVEVVAVLMSHGLIDYNQLFVGR